MTRRLPLKRSLYITLFLAAALLLICSPIHAEEQGDGVTYTPYSDEQKVLFDFYFDSPQKIATALFWLRSYMNPLMDSPYEMAPEFMNIKVIVHGTEIVTLAKHNYEKYSQSVERMKYYASLGVEFRVCNLAAHDFGYTPDDFYDFVVIAPSAITEIAHWQQQGYAIIHPQVFEKRYTTEEIR